MKLVLGLLVFAVSIYSPLAAQAATVGVFDPVPTAIQLNDVQRATIKGEIANYMASEEMTTPEDLQLGQITMWRKASGDGFIACIVMPPQGGRQLQYVAALSVAKGPFATEPVLKKIWDNATYSLYGCNTPGGVQF